MQARRRKLQARAKALMSAINSGNPNATKEVEPFVVLPTHQVSPKLQIDVDKMFDPDKHPGVKRISVYDFEEMMKTKNATIAVSGKYKKEEEEDGEESSEGRLPAPKESLEEISRLQDEIAKLTRTLAELRLVPGLLDSLDEDDDYTGDLDDNYDNDNDDVRASWNHDHLLMERIKSETFLQNSPTAESGKIRLTTSLRPPTTTARRTWFTSTPSTTPRNKGKGII